MSCVLHYLNGQSSHPRPLDPKKPHNLSDRIALIRNEPGRRLAKAIHTTVAFIASIIFKIIKALVFASIFVVRRSIQALISIPSSVYAGLFARGSPELSKFDKIEREVMGFLGRTLNDSLTLKEKLDLQRVIEEAVPEQEKKALIDGLFAPERVVFSSLQTRDEEKFKASLESAKKSLSYLISEAQKALKEQQEALQTPIELLEIAQQKELKQLQLIAEHAKSFNAEEMEGWVSRPDELAYLHQRVHQLQGLALYAKGFNAEDMEASGTPPEELAHLKQKVKRIQQQLPDYDECDALLNAVARVYDLGETERLTSDLLNRLDACTQGDVVYSHLKVEYYSLLNQILALKADQFRLRKYHDQIEGLNRALKVKENVKSTLILRVRATLKDLAPSLAEGLDPTSATFFREAESKLKDIHAKELEQLQEDSKSDIAKSPALGFMHDTCACVVPLLDTQARKTLLEVKTPEQRIQERNTLQMKNLFKACLKQTPDGQHLVRLLDPKTKSREDLHLQMLSQQAFDTLYAKAEMKLSSTMFSTLELAASIEQDQPITSFEEAKAQGRELDLKQISRELDLNLEFWYSSLQQAWLQFLPLSNRDHLVELCVSSRTKKMKKLFCDWMVKKTGLAFNRSLSFTHLVVSPRSAQEIQALEAVRKHYLQSKFHKDFEPRPIEDSDPGFVGASINSVDLPEVVQGSLDVAFELPEMAEGQLQALAGGASVLAQFQGQDPYDATAPVEQKIRWILDACQNPIYQRYDQGERVIFAAFFDLMHHVQGQPIPLELPYALLNLVESSDVVPLEADNSWRAQVLNCYLQLIFSKQPDRFEVTEQESKYLEQIAGLAGFTALPKLEVVQRPNRHDFGIERLGRLLQKTKIGLEGVNEEALQLSFQTSSLPQNAELRSYIDALRARTGAAMPQKLLNYVFAAFPITHDEGQEAIERALMYAFKADPDELLAYLKGNLKGAYTLPAAGWDPEDISADIPPAIFVRDCILKVENDPTTSAEVIEFNQALIASQKASQMLLGFAREVERLSQEFKRAPSPELLKELLKAKIGYQYIKKQQFDGKVRLEGFLKLAVHRAEMEMAQSAHAIAEIAANSDCIDVVNELYQSINPDPDARTLEERALHRIFKLQQEQGLDVRFVNPCFYQFGQSDLDLVTGIVYHNGEQHCELPGELQNNPHVRLLGIHEYPYVLNPDGSYAHYTTEGHRRIAQVRIAKTQEGIVTIQRRLNTSVDGADRFEHLQFVPMSEIHAIPRALEQLGAKEYWTNRRGEIFGYTEKGTLVFALDPEDKTARTPEGSFIFADSVDIEDESPCDSLLDCLEKAISLDEVLINESQTEVCIPSLELTLTLKDDVWQWKSPKISGMVLDLSPSELHQTLVLKWDQEASRKARYELENQLIMLKKHLAEAKAVEGQSFSNKSRITSMERQIVETTKALSNLDRRLFMSLLPERVDREELNATMEYDLDQLNRIAIRLAQTQDPEESRRLQGAYLELEAEYKEAKQSYDAANSKRETVVYETSYPECVLGQDLSATLFLALQELNAGIDINSSAWVHELANHAVKVPFEPKTLSLIEAIIDHKDEAKLLALHCELLLCNHVSAQIEEAKRNLSPDQDRILGTLDTEYKGHVAGCQAAYLELEDEQVEIPSATKTLMYLHGGSPDIVDELHAAEAIKFVPVAEEELRALSSQSLISRLHLASAVEPTPKNAVREIPEEQRKLIKHFKGSGSGAQAAGFYAEAFGMFSLKAFGDELSVNGKFLYGLNKDDVEFLFKEFEKLGWIHQRSTQDIYYSLSAGLGHHPLDCVQKDQILALLSGLSIKPSEQEELARRIETFFFQIAHASFSFSWKDVAGEARFQRAIAKEAERLEAEMLGAKAFLDCYLFEERMTLTELKRSVLVGEELDRPEGREALIRYALYKTELDHLQNVHKAPQQGERNQIELLSMQRQYAVDLLLRAPVNDKEREQQIINLAFLLFEESSGCRCNPMQVRIFSSLVLDSKNPESIDAMQARMGFGKTWLLSLVAIVKHAKEGLLKPEDKSLMCYVVPPAVLQDNAASFNARLEDVLGSCVIQDTPFNRYQIDPDNVARSFEWMLIDLEKRHAFYENARRAGIAIIQPPETRLAMEAQEKALGFMAISGRLQPDEQALCLQAKQLLGRIRAIKGFRVFDELDATQDFRACEVNFTEGRSYPIEAESIKPIEDIIQSVVGARSSDPAILAPHVLRDLQIDDPGDLFATYVTSADKKVSDIPGLAEALGDLDRPSYLSIYLLRAAMLDPNILDFMTNKQPNTHFGVRFSLKGSKRTYSHDPESDSALLIAVPYEGTNNPKGLSTYDCAEVAAITTLRYYASSETLLEEVHLDFLMKQMQRGKIPKCVERCVEGISDSRGKTLIERLRHLTGLVDAAEIEQAKAAFMHDFMDRPRPEVRAFLGRTIVATQVRTDEARANSNRYEMGSPSDELLGCSGTVSSTSSYFEMPFDDPKADGMLSIAIMGRQNNSHVHTLPEVPEPCDNYLEFILTEMLKGAKESTRAIIDVAGICKSPDGLPETIVLKLWELLQAHDMIDGIEGIVFYDKSNIKSLYRGPAYPVVKCTTELELAALSGKKFFTFYGQKNTRGSDVKQAQGAHALVTMDQNAPNADAKQGVLRFRNLVQESSGQTFTFVATHTYASQLQENAAHILSQRTGQPVAADSLNVDASMIVKDLRSRELKQQHIDALVLFRSELKAHAEQAAAHMERQVFGNVDLRQPQNQHVYAGFLQQRDKLCQLVDRSILEIERKYGGAVKDLERDQFTQEECRKCIEKIQGLAGISRAAAGDLRITCPDLHEEFFEHRIEMSKGLFESRYPADTLVRVSTIDSAAEAVAQALAQAQAQALVESVAVTISQAVVQVQDRLPDHRLEMTRQPHFTTPNDWFLNPGGTAVKDIRHMKDLIHPTHQDKILVSPHLCDRTMVSHFALISQDADRPYIFLSQEEADRWITEFEAGQGDYTCVDLRTCDINGDPRIQNMKEAVLQPTAEIPQIFKTQKLRELALPNIVPNQLVPRLYVETQDQAFVSSIFDFSSFGVDKDSKAPLALSLEKKPNLFAIQVGDVRVEMPIENRWLKPIFEGLKCTQGKFYEIKTTFMQSTSALRARLRELELKKRELEAVKNKLKAVVSNASAFDISGDLREGLTDRDRKFRNFNTDIPKVRNCGAAFLAKVERIQEAQRNCERLGTKAAFDQLIKEFNEFISPKMRGCEHLATLPAFTRQYWDDNKGTLPPFDLAYGRILYPVHSGIFSSAKGCSLKDCKNLFNVLLPTMRATLQNLDAKAQEIATVEDKIQAVEAEVQALSAQMLGLDEAEECIKAMQMQAPKLVSAFAEQGILLQEGDLCYIWDRLNFRGLSALPQKSTHADLTAEFPTYKATYMQGAEEYQRRIYALSEPELENLRAHTRLEDSVRKLSCQIEERQELIWH